MRTIGIGIAAVIWLTAAGAAQTKTVWDGVYSEAQAGRGKKLYIANCAACHQESLTGADLAPALKGDEFLLLWNDRTLGELVERVMKTMPQDAPGTLTLEQNTDVVAYMLSVNRMPAGATELPADAAAQKAISITRTK
jgi:S-disulfanyl-L-cysteine oxidoreductase SoxD